MKRTLWKCVAAGCAALLAACGDPTGADPMELRRAMERWQAQNIDDYRMTVRLQGGMIGGAAIITVRDGAPVSVQTIPPSEGMPVTFFEGFDTVEELFEIVVAAHDREAHRIDARYHGELGVPVDVYIDPMRNAVDEEHGFVVDAFEVL